MPGGFSNERSDRMLGPAKIAVLAVCTSSSALCAQRRRALKPEVILHSRTGSGFKLCSWTVSPNSAYGCGSRIALMLTEDKGVPSSVLLHSLALAVMLAQSLGKEKVEGNGFGDLLGKFTIYSASTSAHGL